MDDDEPIGVAALPHLTESELTVLLHAVDAQRRAVSKQPGRGGEVAVLWSLSTAVSQAIIAAQLDARRRSMEMER